MRARKYNKRVEFWQTVEVADTYGGFTVSETLIAESWAQIKTVSNNSRYSQRMTELGVTDPSTAIIVTLRHRNDITYNAVNQYLKYNGIKYIIQNAPTDINLEGVDVEIIAIRDTLKSVNVVL